MSLKQLVCNKTTELGEDEIYFDVAVKKYNAQHQEVDRKSYRLPNGKPWDLNDNGSKSILQNTEMVAFELRDGEYVDVIVSVMESDGGDGEPYRSYAAVILNLMTGSDVATKINQKLTEIAGLLNIKDTDDYIGAFKFRTKRTGTRLYTEWDEVGRTDQRDGYRFKVEENGEKCAIHFIGDGAKYVGLFQMVYNTNF